MQYTEKDLVKIAKRENNTKRNYLVVDPLQGKHIPVSPGKALTLFSDLAETLRGKYKNERILFVGFAETATAIGAQVAVTLGAKYIQTTRELIPGVEYLFFSEEHSHATEQKLVKNDINAVADETDRIIFVEDEVTTGKTILNIITILDKLYEGRFKYAVASLLNGMDEEHLSEYALRNIDLYYLVKTDHSGYVNRAEQFAGDGKYIVCTENAIGSDVGVADFKEYDTFVGSMEDSVEDPIEDKCTLRILNADGYMNSRRIVNAPEYRIACEGIYRKICETYGEYKDKNILVIGTEECMYPALVVGKYFEAAGNTVRSHSTTRSPIAVSTEEDYPLHCRYELRSLYDLERRTFIYDIASYDEVFIVTDAGEGEDEGEIVDTYYNAPVITNSMVPGLATLVNAIRYNNNNITLVRWC